MKIKIINIATKVLTIAVFIFTMYALIWGTSQQLLISVIALIALSFQLTFLIEATKKASKSSLN